MSIAQFRTSDHVCKVDINGIIYEIDVAEEEIFNRVEELIAKIETIDMKDISALTAVMNEARDFIESILGEDSIKMIYKDKKPSLTSILHLMAFITDELTKHKEESISSINKYVKRK